MNHNDEHYYHVMSHQVSELHQPENHNSSLYYRRYQNGQTAGFFTAVGIAGIAAAAGIAAPVITPIAIIGGSIARLIAQDNTN
jgi:hypothetical protein